MINLIDNLETKEAVLADTCIKALELQLFSHQDMITHIKQISTDYIKDRLIQVYVIDLIEKIDNLKALEVLQIASSQEAKQLILKDALTTLLIHQGNIKEAANFYQKAQGFFSRKTQKDFMEAYLSEFIDNLLMFSVECRLQD